MAKIIKLGVQSASEYYFENDKIMNENGNGNNLQITGGLAQIMNLQEGDKLEQTQMTNLLKGLSANGEEQLIDKLKHSSTGKENAAYDIVFSTPKSVSMLSLTVDPRLQEAHNEAVQEVLGFINDNYAKTNAYDSEGKRTLNQGAGLLIATAKHSIARDEDKGVEDPHLHTHSLVFNITKDIEDNKFKALAANDMLQDANKFQEMYRSSLALKVKELGYEIEKHSGNSSAFDIAGVDRENVLHFSQRHNKIVDQATTIKEQEHVQHKGKKDKSDLTKAELLSSWNEQQLSNFGMSFKELKEHCLSNVEKSEKLYADPKQALESAMQALTQTEAVIKEEDLLKLSRKISIGEFSDTQLREEISQIKKTGQSDPNEIKLLGENSKGEKLFTTKHLYDLERENMRIIKNQSPTKQIMSSKEADKAIQDFNDKQSWEMSKGQSKAVKAVLTNNEQYLIINGDPGVGKTTLLAAVSNATDKRKDLDIKVLAPTGKAVKEASEASGLKASTIDSFLFQKPSSSNKQKVYIVDETSMLDSQKANELLKRAKREKAQVVFIGDQKQLKSIGSGDFFSQIQQHVKAVDITEANRFKTDLQKQVAKLANNKELDKALDLLNSHNKVVHLDTSKLNLNTLSSEEIKDHKKTELAKEVSKIVSQNYKEINAYAADNAQVEKINLQVRKDIGFHYKETIQIDTLKPKPNMSQAQNKAIAANYEKGDIIQLNRSVKGMKKFAEYELKEIDTKTNKLTLEAKFSDQNGSSKIHSVTVDARELLSASISEKNKLNIAQGEKIVITRNNKELGINNGDIGFVKSFNRDKKELIVSFDKKEVIINTQEFKNLNYAYATSVHKGQGASVDKAVLVLDSDNALQNKYNLGEVGMTRQKNDLIVITDNLETVKEQLKTEQTKTSTLEKSETKNDNLSLAS